MSDIDKLLHDLEGLEDQAESLWVETPCATARSRALWRASETLAEIANDLRDAVRRDAESGAE